MNYFIRKLLYLFRYLINSKRFKKLITIVLIVFVLLEIYDLYYSKVHAAEIIEDATYFDGVQATYKDYEALQNDFVVRLLNYIKINGITGAVSTTLSRMANGGLSVMFWYGDALGTQYQNTYPSVSQKNIIEVILMDQSQVTSNVTDFDWGLNGIQGVRGYLCNTNYYEFKFTRGSVNAYTLQANTARHYLPSYLVDYRASSLVMLLNEFSKGTLLDNTQALITAIENQTDTIEEQRTNNNK